MDKSNLKESNVTEIERRLFEELKEVLQLVDPFPATNRIRFNWDSKRRDGSRVLARFCEWKWALLGPLAVVRQLPYRLPWCRKLPDLIWIC